MCVCVCVCVCVLQVQGDVFRFPPYYPFFCAMVGTGVQVRVSEFRYDLTRIAFRVI